MPIDMHPINYVFRDHQSNHDSYIHRHIQCILFLYVPLDEYRRALREKRAFHTWVYRISGPGVIVMSEDDVNEECLTQLDKNQNGIYPYMCCYVEVRLERDATQVGKYQL